MEVINDLGVNLKIIQHPNILSFTQDAVLLAKFTQISNKDRKCLDFCSGTGVISLLLAESYSNIEIQCVEIDTQSYDLCQKNIKLNNFEDRLQAYNLDVIGCSKKYLKNSYDIIVCNPPYFKVDENSNVNPNYQLAIARHEILITLEDIVKEAKLLLKTEGKILFVYRPERLSELITILKEYGFMITRIQNVHQKLGKKCNTILLEAKKTNKNTNLFIESPIIIENEMRK